VMSTRVKIILAGLSTVLGLAGVVVVAQQDPPNVDLDCVLPPLGADGPGVCTSIWEPPPGQCEAVWRQEDPGGVPGRVFRALRELEEWRVVNGIPTRAIMGWTVHAIDPPVDGGITSPGCWIEVRMSIFRRTLGNGQRVIDGQAPAYRAKVNALGVGSIVKPAFLSRRPAYAKRGGCRGAVIYGEQPCTPSEEIADAGYEDDPDGGP
jgi:hypothetical protein